jgi:hypothetical protein
LNSYGIRGVANLWFESNLPHRKYVEINSMKQGAYVSTAKEITYGVPQGSILGPMLFLLHVNYLPLNITESKIVLFADDTNCISCYVLGLTSLPWCLFYDTKPSKLPVLQFS